VGDVGFILGIYAAGTLADTDLRLGFGGDVFDGFLGFRQGHLRALMGRSSESNMDKKRTVHWSAASRKVFCSPAMTCRIRGGPVHNTGFNQLPFFPTPLRFNGIIHYNLPA